MIITGHENLYQKVKQQIMRVSQMVGGVEDVICADMF